MACFFALATRRPTFCGFLAFAVLLILLPCRALAGEPTLESPLPAESLAGSVTPIDPDGARERLRQVDSRFNAAARQRDRQSFHDLLASDAVFLAGELHAGRLAVMAIWQHLFDGKYDFRYDAETLEVSVARSGELGWSLGRVKTSFQRPGAATEDVTEGHYLNVWKRAENGSWQLAYLSSLVVHPTLGAARDPRGGLMTAWPELADQIGSHMEIRWLPEISVRADSGELAYEFGAYEASFTPAAAQDGRGGEETSAAAVAGKGHFLALWHKDAKGHWQLAGEGFTPPGIYGGR